MIIEDQKLFVLIRAVNLNHDVRKYLKKEGIHVFYTQNSQIKSNFAERVIRTIKQKIYAYFMENQTYKYINVLQKIVDSYNNTPINPWEDQHQHL